MGTTPGRANRSKTRSLESFISRLRECLNETPSPNGAQSGSGLTRLLPTARRKSSSPHRQ